MHASYEKLRIELDRTEVISASFKHWIIVNSLAVQHEAYDHGKKAGIAECKRAHKKKGPRKKND